MKRLLFLIVIIILLFCCDDVFAGCTLSSNRSDSTHSNVSLMYTTEYIGSATTDVCGPYFSYNNSNSDVLFVRLVNSSDGVIYKLDSNVGLMASNNREAQMLKQYGWISKSLVCPSFLRDTGKVEKHSTGSTDGDIEVYEDKQDNNGFFYSQGSKSCSYKNSSTGFNIVFNNENNRHLYVNNGSGSGVGGSWFKYALFFIDDGNFDHWFGITDTLVSKNTQNNNIFSSDTIKQVKEFSLDSCDPVYIIKGDVFDTYLVFPSEGMANDYLKYVKDSVDDGNFPKDKDFTPQKLEGKLVEQISYASKDVVAVSKFKRALEDIRSCKTDDRNCVNSKWPTLEKAIMDISTWCNSVYSTCDYNSELIEYCDDADKNIDDVRAKYDIANVAACGLSERVIKWIANIFKWVKYFMPALVVILTILDFIKAIGSQNEDDLKKAQGKLVKRIIVAALFFIVPFLLEFAMEAFHLVTDNPYCGLF